MDTASPPAWPRRNRSLDGIRGLAILLVLLQHCLADPLEKAGSLGQLVRSIADIGYTGVDLFFALSGFLITGLLLDNAASPVLLRTFYLRRAFRIVPLYLMFLLAYVILRPLVHGVAADWLRGDSFPLWVYFTFTQNIAIGLTNQWCTDWMIPTWSLAIEEQFYLILPMIILFVPRKRLVPTFAAGIALACLFRQGSEPDLRSWVMMPWRMDCLMAGSAIAVLVRNAGFVDAVRRHRTKLTSALPFLIAGWFILFRKHWPVGNGRFLLMAALFGTLVLLAHLDESPRLRRVLQNPGLTWLGTVSFGIYLLHIPIIGFLFIWLRGFAPAFHTRYDPPVMALGLLVTFIAAELSYRYFERPILEMGHRFRYRPASAG